MIRGLHWFRRDLRLRDNHALDALCERVEEWLPVFVLDPVLLAHADTGAARLAFLLDALGRLSEELARRGVPLRIERGQPTSVLTRLARSTGASVVSFNTDVTPFALRRDDDVRRSLSRMGVELLEHRTDVVFTAEEVTKPDGSGYVVYTPFRRAWWKRWQAEPRPPLRRRRLPPPIAGFEANQPPTLDELGRRDTVPSLPSAGEAPARRRLARFLEGAARYEELRDEPAVDGTSRLSPHLRFGTISVRTCLAEALRVAAEHPRSANGIRKWLDELVWREFYAAILERNPRVLRRNHRTEYDSLHWENDPAGLAAWSEGRTGYPIVDAGMRQLQSTGWMHNRVRMITASFLTKDLLIDWREGERFFFRRLVDGDPASNSGGWQWSASTGTDAQPYFRIFNPVAQGRRYDPDGVYVRRWIPELRAFDGRCIHAPWESGPLPGGYPPPIVDHAFARTRALARFRAARRESGT
jgi:deoxyribodipyrimidine photo-lyase